MVICIKETLDIPIYMQVRNQIVQGISSGELEPGEQLPTVRALAQELGINTMTISKAYQILKQEGYIYTDRRSGARIRDSFERVVLSHENEELLRKIISEAKICSLSKEQILEKCSKIYDGENR